MTTAPNREPTLSDVIERLDKLTDDVEKVSSDVEKLSSDVKRFDERFTDDRQATQWVVQLAFTLIASATITVIITAVFRK
jgi:hypothetical protein